MFVNAGPVPAAGGGSTLYNCDIHEPLVENGENKTPLLSFMYNWVANPSWRRLLMSFVAFARSRALLREGTRIAARMAIIAITTITSIRVNAGGTIVGHVIVGVKRHDIRFDSRVKAKRGASRRKFACGRIRPVAELLDKTLVVSCM